MLIAVVGRCGVDSFECIRVGSGSCHELRGVVNRVGNLLGMCCAPEEFGFVSGLPLRVYEQLRVSLGTIESVYEIRHQVLSCIAVSAGYLEMNAMEMLKSGFFACTQGDLWARVQHLQAAPVPPDAEIAQVQTCAKFFPVETFQALQLLRDSPCTTCLVEKGHSAAGFVRRAHSQVGADNLVSRAFIAECRQLIRHSPKARELCRLDELWLRNLHAARSVRVTANNVFAHNVLSACAQNSSASIPSVRKAAMQKCIAAQHQHYRALDVTEKVAFQDAAACVKVARRSSRLDDAAACFAEKEKLLEEQRRTVCAGDFWRHVNSD